MVDLKKGYYASPRWSWEILDCAMPMTFDTYSNCAHQCVYCFSFFQRAIGKAKDDYLAHKVRSVNVEKVKRMFENPDKYAGQFAWYIKRKMVLQWGGLSDGFDWYEKKFRKSLELLKFFREIDYPISISTKGVWFLDDPEYVEAFTDARNVQMKYSIITTNEDHAQSLEPGTPSSQERFDAMRRLKALGVGCVTLRFRPYILGVSDLCVDEIFEQADLAGVDSLTAEFLCIESRASNNAKERYKLIGDVSGIDTFAFYRANSGKKNGLLRLNYELKRAHFDRMEKLAAKYEIPFFVSDAHHKERSASAGCCGLPTTGPLSQMNLGQYAEAIQIAKKKGRVHWSDISESAEGLKNIPWVGAEGYNHGSTAARAKYKFASMYEFMQTVWNTTKDVNSPARYFGGALVPSGVDGNGDIIYLYNKPFINDGIRVETLAELKLYDEKMTELQTDGSQYGYVAHPIFVVSTGVNPVGAHAIDLLQSARLLFTVLVENSALDAYQRRFPNVDFLPLPNGVSGEQFALDNCRGEGLPHCWIINSRVKTFTVDGAESSPRSVLSGIEALASKYTNLGLAGAGPGRKANGPFKVNRDVSNCVLVNTQTGVQFSPEFERLAWLDLTVKSLSIGWGTLRSHRFSVKCSSGSRNRGAEAMFNNRWQNCTTLNQKRLKVYWGMFNFPLQVRDETG